MVLLAEGPELGELENMQKNRTYQARLTFGRPLWLPTKQQQRVKLHFLAYLYLSTRVWEHSGSAPIFSSMAP